MCPRARRPLWPLWEPRREAQTAGVSRRSVRARERACAPAFTRPPSAVVGSRRDGLGPSCPVPRGGARRFVAVRANRHRWNSHVNVSPNQEKACPRARRASRVEESPHAIAAGNPTMDVQCERCKTEYEFDDALVSGRGTTVRCTSCGHQFKVRRAAGDDATGDRWLVKTANGHQFTFVTLRELQRAILAHQVSKNDLLRRAGSPPRPLGSISELEPFFEGRTTSN